MRDVFLFPRPLVGLLRRPRAVVKMETDRTRGAIAINAPIFVQFAAKGYRFVRRKNRPQRRRICDSERDVAQHGQRQSSDVLRLQRANATDGDTSKYENIAPRLRNI